ncbi:B12-binding domain-containing radical SAM protein [Solihabitans fulvus]|uniref:B12-binding domain-containing radical SAM protein n=1 Tax=Solihabitans fulvus TaxID=1892852 RepID=A0A5B2XCR8_9PSEU|nr:radical SAM protein [Solihabitans fulvus]KAA2261103.1 B12-binding domain-containing radical SAM protein [Solihabitans fulvus]
MRVALLYPEVYDMARFKEHRREFPPFGVLYLAAVVEQAGHEAAIHKVTPQTTELDLTSFDAVGFSLASSATYGFMREARERSCIRSDALVMVGGVHCNFYPEQSLTDFRAHVASDGESEETILAILERAHSKQFLGVAGVLWRDGWELKREPSRPLLKSIDHLPLPARHLLPQDDFVISDRLAGTDTRMAHVMFSRGCPFPCSFCAAGQTRIQYRSGASARRELIHLKDSYGIEGFAIVDDNFIVSKQKVSDICEQIEDLGLKWSALSRVDTIDEALLSKMARSGCIEVKYGMESGSELLLKTMRKNTKREQIKRAVHAAVDAGIEAKVFIIHGFPGENMETTRETIELLGELGSTLSRVSLFRFVPLPGTQVYDKAETYGVRGTHLQADWDGNWSKFHIHHNERQWWGSDDDWQETEESYLALRDFVESNWNAQG